MKRLIAIALIMVAATAFAASQKLNELPLIGKIKDDARMYVYDTLSGNRNITGANFRQQAAGGDGPLIKQAQASYSSTKANTPNSIYRRIIEVRDRSGKIVQYTTANGALVFGTPVPLSVNSVYPTNGSTGWYNNYSSGTGGLKRMIPAPSVTYNKGTRSLSSTTDQYIVGKTLGFDSTSEGTNVRFVSYSVAAGTTYTIRVMRQSIVQYDGEWTSSCGSGMTDMGGYCESTFTTR